MVQKDIISSSGNAQIKRLALLQKKAREREKQGLFIVEGKKMFQEARKAQLIVKAYAGESFYRKIMEEKPGYFDEVDYEVVKDSVLKEVSDTKTPQGIMGMVRRYQYRLEDMLAIPDACLLILEDIRDPGNLGTMIRTAEGAGITGIISSAASVDLYHPKVIRATMGSIYRVPFYQTSNLCEALLQIKQKGITVYAAHLLGMPYDTEGSFCGSCAFLIGNEANGLSEKAASFADTLIKIPMRGQVESLNAAVAAAVLMYEAARQRKRK